MALAVLSVDMVARLASMEAGFDKAYRLAEKNARGIESRLNRITATAKAVGGAVAGAFAGVSLVRVFDGVVDGIDRLNDLKDATGSTIANLSGLEDIARRNDVAFETFSDGLLKFNQVLGNAKPGSVQAEILSRIGLSARELRQLDPAEALRRVAEALSTYSDGGNKARLIQELFGKSTREVAAFLKDLGTQTRLVGTITEEQAEAAEKYNKQLAAIGKNAQDAARKLLGGLLPAINQVLGAIAKGGVRDGVNEFGEQIGFGQEFFDRLRIKGARQRVESLEVQVADPSLFDRLTGRTENLRKDLEKERAELDKLLVAYQRLSDGAAGGGRGFVNLPFTPGGGLEAPDVSGITGDKKTGREPREIIDASREALGRYIDEQQRAIDGVNEQIDRLQELSEVEKALAQLKELGALGEVAQVRELVLGMAQKRDALEDELDLQRQLKDIEKERAEQQKGLDARLDELSGRIGDDTKRQLTGRLEQRLQAGESFSPEELDRIVRGIGGVNEELAKSKGIAEDLGLSFSSAFEDAIVGGGQLGDVLKGLEQDILRIVTRKLVTEPLGNAVTSFIGGVTGGGSGGGGGIGSFISSLFSGFFAEGGFIPPNRWGIAGERGPEPVFGGRTGVTVRPAGQGGPVNLYLTVPQGTSRESAMQTAARAAAGLQRAQRNL